MTNIYFAGGESHSKRLVQHNCKNILLSYYYMQKFNNVKRHKEIIDFLNIFKANKINLMLDSGAHSLQIQGGNKNTDIGKLKVYVNDYITFLRKFKDYFNTSVELDIEDIVGMKLVDSWYEDMKDYGLNPIRVWHINRGVDTWNEYCKEHKYVGVGNFSHLDVSAINSLFEYAIKYRTKIHGFGTTKFNMLKAHPFYSVDSTSWLAGEQYGNVYVFTGNNLKSLSKDSFIKKHKQLISNYKDITHWNLVQWNRYADYLQEYWKN